ncbi:Dyp-type peroxidase [Actinophytocola sp.]|uniref:Dyp-type peroxidase n=1 Tax=Actinophytocola sp. TaxID=1872138 RepID=UPI00389A496A
MSSELMSAFECLQGNILKSHGRDHCTFVFLRFDKGTDNAHKCLAAITARVGSAKVQWEESRERATRMAEAEAGSETERAREIARVRAAGTEFVTLLVSASGYRALGVAEADQPDDSAFRRGARYPDTVKCLRDPNPATWQEEYRSGLDLDALLLVAHDDADELATSVADIEADLTPYCTVAHREQGTAMRLDKEGRWDPNGEVREHFGFRDGISQPLFFAKDVTGARRWPKGQSSFDPSAQLRLVLAKDPHGDPYGYGSYFVFRKLRQDVAAFRADRTRLASELARRGGGAARDFEQLAGAYLVGRFPDGTPVTCQKEPGLGAVEAFDYDGDDGVRCPHAAHIRKTNPRGDAEDRENRVVRRGYSYGKVTLDPGPDEDVGLLFLCAQSNIGNGFHTQTIIWANDPGFPVTDTGPDSMIGPRRFDGPHAPTQKWPSRYGCDENQLFSCPRLGPWVTLRGAEYFFAPSLAGLRSLAANRR